VRKDYYNKKEPTLCEFSKVEIRIPRLKLIKLVWEKHFNQSDDTVFLMVLEARVEAAQNKLAHVRSLIDKALLKSGRKT
jgi:hypothetical protein